MGSSKEFTRVRMSKMCIWDYLQPLSRHHLERSEKYQLQKEVHTAICENAFGYANARIKAEGRGNRSEISFCELKKNKTIKSQCNYVAAWLLSLYISHPHKCELENIVGHSAWYLNVFDLTLGALITCSDGLQCRF